MKAQAAKPQNDIQPFLMYPGSQRVSQTCQGTLLIIHKMLDWILVTTRHGFRVILTCGQSPHECPNCLATEITSIAKPGSKCFLFTSKSKINVIHATLCKYNCKDSSSKNRSGRKARTVMSGITATSAQVRKTKKLCRVSWWHFPLQQLASQKVSKEPGKNKLHHSVLVIIF